MRRLLAICGILAPLVYIAAVILGGLLWSSYSHLANAISELIGVGAPNRPLLEGIFSAYNGLLALFGLGIIVYVKQKSAISMKTVGALLMAIGILGIAWTLFFPQDVRGTPATFAGTMHLVLAGVISLLTIIAVLFSLLSLKYYHNLANLRLYFLVTLIVIIIFGIITAVSTSQESPYLGLFERITIGAFIIWVFVLAVRLLSLKFDA